MQNTATFLGFLKSLKCRLIVMAVLLAIIPSLIVGNGILLSYEMRALSIRESEVMGQARIIANQIAISNYIDGEKRYIVAPSGLKVMSMAFLIDALDRPIIWRGPQKTGAIKQLISDCNWGELDYLIIDNPPGTGDEPLTVLQTIPDADAVIMVTTPNVVSQEDVLKCVKMVNMLNVQNIGLIENMAYYICPHCGEKLHIFGEGNGKAFAEEMEITYLGDLPIEEKVSNSPNEDGVIATIDPNDEVSKRFVEIVEDIQKEFIKE